MSSPDPPDCLSCGLFQQATWVLQTAGRVRATQHGAEDPSISQLVVQLNRQTEETVPEVGGGEVADERAGNADWRSSRFPARALATLRAQRTVVTAYRTAALLSAPATITTTNIETRK